MKKMDGNERENLYKNLIAKIKPVGAAFDKSLKVKKQYSRDDDWRYLYNDYAKNIEKKAKSLREPNRSALTRRITRGTYQPDPLRPAWGMDPDYDGPYAYISYSEIPIFEVIKSGHIEYVKDAIVALPSNYIDIRNKEGETPLIAFISEICWSGRNQMVNNWMLSEIEEVLEMLIARGAHVNARAESSEETALHIAARWLHQSPTKPIIELLIKKGRTLISGTPGPELL